MLPKLRPGISVRFSGYDHDSIPQWLIHDSGRNKFFVIGFPEYEMLCRWHLNDPNAIIEAVNTETTLVIDESDLESLIKFLEFNYLTEQSGHKIYQRAKKEKIIKKDNIWYWFVRYYLFFKIPLFHLDKFLTRTIKIADFIFHRYLGYLMIFLAVVALYQIGVQWQEFKNTFSTILSWQGFLFYIIGFMIAKFFHELGHAYKCKQYGVPVPTLGIAFLVFFPVLYTDTTLSWSLSSRQRLQIALAGIWIESYVTIIAALIWANVHNLTVQMVCYLIITVNWATSLLINASPFMRFDGYYILADLLKMPNLQFRAFALARWQIRNWLFGWEEPPHEHFSKRMHWTLVIYSFVTWIYRLIIYFGIALLVYYLFFKILGTLLFAIELFVFVLDPIINELRTWHLLKKQFSFNRRTKVTISVFLILLFIFFLPFDQNIKLHATLSYKHEFLFAPQDGILSNSLPLLGSDVKANQIVVHLVSPEIDYNLKKTKLEYQRLLTEFRRATINSKYSKNLPSVLSDLDKKKSEYEKLVSLKEQMDLKAPFDGKISEIASDLYPGVVVMKDQLMADVIDSNKPEVQAYATEIDFEKLLLNLKGVFYPENLSDPAIPVKVVAIEPLNASQLNWHYSKKLKQTIQENIVVDTPSYLASELGGKIATNLSKGGEYIPVDSVYLVILNPEKAVTLNYIQRGTVVLYVSPRSYAYRFFYFLKKIWVKESGF